MALAMPSRFAVLKIEDDDFRPANPTKTKDKKKTDTKQNGKKTEKAVVAVKKPSKKKDKKKKETAEQWEQWKSKDNELVDGNYEQDLHDAILLSKLDYEEKKGVYKQSKKDADHEKKALSDNQNGKKKKGKAMSLEQFNTLVSTQDGKGDGSEAEPSADVESDEQFFERLNSEAKEEINREQKNEREMKIDSKKPRKTFNNETITIAQYQEKLEAKEVENARLISDLEKSKKEILAVKTRNKTLCGILAHGEMKDKADVLLELDKLSRVRDELTEEVMRLHGLLEQERSKVGALTAEPHNTHNNHGKKEKHRKKGAA